MGVIWRRAFFFTEHESLRTHRRKEMTENGVDAEGLRAEDSQRLYKLDPARSSG